MNRHARFLLALPFLLLACALQETIPVAGVKLPLLPAIAVHIALTRRLQPTILWCAALGILLDSGSNLPLCCNTTLLVATGTLVNRLATILPRGKQPLCALFTLLLVPVQRIWVALWILDPATVGGIRGLLACAGIGAICGWIVPPVSTTLFGPGSQSSARSPNKEFAL